MRVLVRPHCVSVTPVCRSAHAESTVACAAPWTYPLSSRTTSNIEEGEARRAADAAAGIDRVAQSEADERAMLADQGRRLRGAA